MNRNDILSAIQRHKDERDRIVSESNRSASLQREDITNREKSLQTFILQAQSRIDKLSGAIEAFEFMLTSLSDESNSDPLV